MAQAGSCQNVIIIATYGFGRALDLNEAHTAVTGNRESLVVAEARNLNASLETGLEDGVGAVDLDTAKVIIETKMEAQLTWTGLSSTYTLNLLPNT